MSSAIDKPESKSWSKVQALNIKSQVQKGKSERLVLTLSSLCLLQQHWQITVEFTGLSWAALVNKTLKRPLHFMLDISLLTQLNVDTKFFHRNFQKILFVIGLILTFWRSYECLQKYLYSNLSTKVTMESSFDIVRPSIVICPTYQESFKIEQV